MLTGFPTSERIRGNKEQLAYLLLEQKRRRGKQDLHFLCKKILGYEDLTKRSGFHGELCEHLEDDSARFKLTLTPRGSLKTSVTIGKIIKSIINNSNIRILIASEEFKLSTKILSEIKGHFEKNEKFRRLYGDLVGKDKWTESEIIVATRTNWKKEPTITCAGVDVTKVGMHYDIIFVDDPHSTKNTDNIDQIDKVIRWYKLLLSLLDPPTKRNPMGGYLYITGTIWHYADLYNHIIEKERQRKKLGRKSKFLVYKRESFKGTIDDLINDRVKKTDLLWRQRLTRDYLKDQLIEQGPYIFSCQYQLSPIDDENAIFKRSWMRACTREAVPDNIKIYSSVDPMRDEEGKDFLAITTVAVDERFRYYILDVTRDKANEHDTVEAMKATQAKWKPTKIGIEEVAWQKSYARYLKLIMLMNGVRIPVTPLKIDIGKSKRFRIKSMVPYFQAGLVKFVTPDGTIESIEGDMKYLFDELCGYPKTANDDCVDALSMIDLMSKRPSALKVLKKVTKHRSFNSLREKVKSSKKKRLGHRNLREIA